VPVVPWPVIHQDVIVDHVIITVARATSSANHDSTAAFKNCVIDDRGVAYFVALLYAPARAVVDQIVSDQVVVCMDVDSMHPQRISVAFSGSIDVVNHITVDGGVSGASVDVDACAAVAFASRALDVINFVALDKPIASGPLNANAG
jgi:hypothetical protein